MNCTDKYITLAEKYPPSEPCSCEVCTNYCCRPGWWTVKEAEAVLNIGLGYRMMLELSPDFTFGVLSPAFKGNEGNFALQIFSHNSCTFLKDNLCELYNTGLQPLECRFCHHSRKGEGIKCHLDIEKEWNSSAGQELVKIWTHHFHIKFH
ncbi:hypothetical protein BA6E_11336 [Bacteroidales bacterium 6E]|nr:hypothetical protein BA6E_11336 [Bacteroidales bacterium 6E]